MLKQRDFFVHRQWRDGNGAAKQMRLGLQLPWVAVPPPGSPAPLPIVTLSQPPPTLRLSTYRQTTTTQNVRDVSAMTSGFQNKSQTKEEARLLSSALYCRRFFIAVLQSVRSALSVCWSPLLCIKQPKYLNWLKTHEFTSSMLCPK